MIKKLLFILYFGIISLSLFSQRPIMELTFTAVDSGAYVQLDSIKVMNRSQGCDTTLYWPDTVLSFSYVGMTEILDGSFTFKVLQNFPNPVTDQTKVSLYVPDKDKVRIIVTDILGRQAVQSIKVLDKGTHSFRFTPGTGNLYFFTAQWQKRTSSIKILNCSSASNVCLLDYIGGESRTLKHIANEVFSDFSFTPGDELLCIGYANSLQSGISDSPEESTTYTIQYATNIPCPGTPIVEYEGQVYNTVQIFGQCWLKENLNVGEMVDGAMEQSDNGTIEKYCYNNEPDSCTKYGGLYQWNELMQYSTQQGVQGICPPGWHLPTHEEWKVLEGAVDSEYAIGDSTWDEYGSRGTDAGTKLKTTSGWDMDGNGTDVFGFSGLPSGSRSGNGFWGVSLYSGTWSSSGDLNTVSYRFLDNNPRVVADHISKGFGLSVRCLRDY